MTPTSLEVAAVALTVMFVTLILAVAILRGGK